MRGIKKIWLVLLVLGLIVSAGWFVLGRSYYPPILMYHSLDPSRTNTPTITPEGFRRHMEFIRRKGYDVISLEDLAEAIKKGKVPRRAVVITFDDGYKDNLEAIKVLDEFGFPATIFVIVGRVGDDGFLSREDLVEVERKTPVKFGLHTMNHCVLYECKDPKFEIVEGKRRLEEILGREVRVFSYPVGGFNREIQEMVRSAGFLCAVTTNRGYSRSMDVYALRRIKMKDSDKGWKLWFKLSGYYDLFRKIRRPE